jgi:hypothetical protein
MFQLSKVPITMSTIIFTLHLIALVGLFNAQYPAEDATLFGRYTMRYALLLGGAVFVTLVWGGITLWHGRISTWIARLPRWLVLTLGAISPVVVWFFWQANVNRSATWFMMMILYAIVIYIAHQQQQGDNDQSMPTGWMQPVMGVIAVGLAFAFALQALSAPAPYWPQDEAVWADLSTMYLRDNASLYLDDFKGMIVAPSIGAGTFLFLGIPLQVLGFTPYVGRILVILAYLGGGFFAYRTTRNLSNRTSALISTILLLSSMNLVQAYEFRPHHLLPVLVALLLWITVKLPAYDDTILHQGKLSSLAWGIGFGAVNGIQLHAAGIIYAFAFSVFFVLLWLWRWRTHRDGLDFFWRGVLPYGIGAFLGVVIFFFVNILPVGGLNAYLELIGRTSGGGNIAFLPIYLTDVYGIYWRVDIVLMIAGWLGGSWLLFTIRDQAPQRMAIVTLWLLTMLFGLFFDSYGYPHLYVVFLAVIGGLLVGNIYSRRASAFAGHWVPFFVALAVLPSVISHLSWMDIGHFVTGQHAPLYDSNPKIADQLDIYWTDDDMLLTTDLLLCSLPERENWQGIYGTLIYNRYYADEDLAQQWRDLGVTVVAYVNDDAFISAGQVGLMTGVLDYMRENDFWICDEFAVEPYTVTIYRPQADLEANYCPNPEQVYADAIS